MEDILFFTSEKMSNEEKIGRTSHECVVHLLKDNQMSS